MSQFPKQSKYTEKSAKNINDAVEAALAELNTTRDKVTIDIISEGSKGFLGLGAKDAKVRVTVKGDAPQAKAAATKASKAAAAKSAPKSSKKPSKAQKPQTAQETSGVGADFTAPSRDADPVTAAETFLKSLFASMKLEVNAEATLDGDELTVNLEGDNMGIIIGKRGDTLDSIQYLTSLVVNRRTEDYIKVTIDTENYREKRREALIALSERLAAKVAKSGRKFTLEPMNPYERRIIHSNLQEYEGVSTYSIGTEPYRKVVIAPKNARPRYENKRERKPVEPKDENDVSYTTTYKADFVATPHKAEYKNYEEYLQAQNGGLSVDSDDE